MTEVLSFRDQQLETCRQRMITTRTEAVNLLTRARQQSIDVGTHKFKKPGIGDKIPQGKIGETMVSVLSRFLSQSGAKQYNPTAEHRDWTQNPEFIALQLPAHISTTRKKPS